MSADTNHALGVFLKHHRPVEYENEIIEFVKNFGCLLDSLTGELEARGAGDIVFYTKAGPSEFRNNIVLECWDNTAPTTPILFTVFFSFQKQTISFVFSSLPEHQCLVPVNLEPRSFALQQVPTAMQFLADTVTKWFGRDKTVKESL